MSLDQTGAALVYAGSTAVSWAKTLLVAGAQAKANLHLMEKQHRAYSRIRREQRELTQLAINSYADGVTNLLDDMSGAYPDVPEAARYTPVDPCAELRDLASCNLERAPRAGAWAACINRFNVQNDIARMVMFDPRWTSNMDLHAMTLGDLLRGRFPATKPLLSESAELDAFEERNPEGGYKTPRNYGLSRSRMTELGKAELGEEAQMMSQVAPPNRRSDLRFLMDDPANRVALALSQAQLIQNSLQNLFNRNAEKPPHRLAILNARIERLINRLQFQASKANMIDSHVPNYAAIYQPAINALTSGPLSGAFTGQPANRNTSSSINYQPAVNYDKIGGGK
jgi:hypothetical protein